ncbi:MAG: exonuclease domain-containing protein [Bacteroidota bacterium]
MYAILDIESTGGKYNEEGITEIAIYKFDGHQVVDQFISLVNPEREIQSFVVGLTGINNEMLRHAPKFYEIAKRVVEITENCILVAHNAKFDHRILRTEFSRLGYEFERQTLCTVELSQKLLPEEPSYSLGKLVKSLGIPISGRHRASGDALATVKLFQLLIDKDENKNIIGENIKFQPSKSKDKKHIRLIESLPSKVGIYYFFNEDGAIIYIGKSKNIKNRANQHFTNDSPKSKKIQAEIESVEYELTGNELLALLKENQAIKKLKPKYNRALKRNIFSHGLFHKIDEKGYINFYIALAKNKKGAITTFTSLHRAKKTLDYIVKEFQLCQRLAGVYKTDGACFNYTIKECLGACVEEESAEDYNQRAQQVIDKYSFKNDTMLLVGKGRNPSEKSAVYIKNGKIYGIAYFDLNFQIQNQPILEKLITPLNDDRDARHIVQSYLRRFPKQVQVISLN